jgi:two-component system chemotaxis sensor kinase CheA
LISGAPVYRLRDMLLPLVRLDEQLGLVPFGSADADLQVDGERGGFIVVLHMHTEQQRFGLVVDDVLDTQEIVVKPLGRHLKGIPVYAGATILGDGLVVLILDAATLARSRWRWSPGWRRSRPPRSNASVGVRWCKYRAATLCR